MSSTRRAYDVRGVLSSQTPVSGAREIIGIGPHVRGSGEGGTRARAAKPNLTFDHMSTPVPGL
ncbi:hypothetical protein GCM10018787_30040 [Streptomyces thermodiastaticus]|nr:hypothetical protein GCM10018787_30040 [Streptomyces thermodiastaticus]